MSDALARLLTLTAGLAALLVTLSLLVSAGVLHGLDLAVAQALARAWNPALQPLFQGLAVLGGVEATTLGAGALFLFLWRRVGLRAALAVGALAGALVVEVAFKRFFLHPGPPRSLSHPDGPSLSDLAGSSLQLQASFPSGHMTRTVLVYGLAAFVAHRLARAGGARSLVVPAAIVLCLAMAFDRVYLEVHWASDVLGGLVLGLLGLVVGITWLELRGGTEVD